MGKRRFWQVIVISAVIVIAVVLGGVSSNIKFRLNVVDGNETLLDRQYSVRFATYVKVMTKFKGDYMAFYDSYDDKVAALNDLNAHLYHDIVNSTAKLEKESTPNTLNWQKEGYEINKGTAGVVLDRIEMFKSVFQNFGKEVSVKAVKYNVEPAPSVDQLLSATKKLSEFSTNYSTSTAERKFNIELAAKFIDGCVIKPYESFSFNKVVGERTAARGFKSAIVIEKGQFVEGIGGGVCQASTTLYNAALYAGMEIETVRHHSLPVSYVPLSFDAMVSSSSDFVFYNPTEYDICIRANADGQKVSFTFFGKSVYGDSVVKLRSVTLKQLSESYDTVIDTQNQLGEEESERIIEYAKIGYVSEGYIDIYNGGKLVSSKKIRQDTYQPQRGKKLVKMSTDTYSGAGSDAA